MAKGRSNGGLEGTPSFGRSKQKQVRAFFDNNVVQQYVDDFQNQLGLSRVSLWQDAAVVLVVGKTTLWRQIKKVGRHGMQGGADPQPRIREMLRYIAATDQKVSVPAGREIVLRSLAATLIHVRAQLPGYTDQTITACEVELLRYALEHPGYLDEEGGVTEKMIDKMQDEIGHTLRHIRSRSASEAVGTVRLIIKAWRPSWLVLELSLPYQWIYYKYEKFSQTYNLR